MVFIFNTKLLLESLINKKTKPTAISIRVQTNGKASKVISSPKIAVKPQIKTIK